MFHFRAATPDRDYHLAKNYVDLLKERMQNGEGALFHAVEVPDLVKRGAYVCAVLANREASTGSPVGYLHYVVDGEPRQQIMGLIVHPAVRGRGIGAMLIAYARCHATNLFSQALPAGCVVRVLPDGQVNQASLRSFLHVGFVAGEIIRIAISGSASDAHLFHSKEEDGTYRAQRLRATADSILAADALFRTRINSGWVRN